MELRKGRGLDAVPLHVGPLLRAVCSIAESDRPDQLRSKVRLRIGGLCSRLPEDLRLAAEVALGLHPEVQAEFFEQRKHWLAARFDRNPRTALRRVDAALLLLGEYLDEAMHEEDAPMAGEGRWYVESLRSTLRLDVDPPVLAEERCIVATVEDLEEITLAFSVPRDPEAADAPLGGQLMYGGEIVESRQVSASHASFVMRLPRRLAVGQRHEYGIQFSGPGRGQLRPYYVLTPLTKCKQFYVRVRFGEKDRPEQIWVLNGVPSRVVDDFTTRQEAKRVDSVGEVFLRFHDLTQGLSYGLHWAPPTATTERRS